MPDYRSNYRSWRGRGGRYMPDMRPVNPLVQTKESPPPPLGHLVEAINQKDLKNTGEESVNYGITETELIASYNWADQKAPKIIVPGRPRLWKPLEKPRQLEEDNGVYYRDNNSAFFPEHPLEPAIVSVMKMHPQSLDIDIVGCNSTIGNLLRYWESEALDTLSQRLTPLGLPTSDRQGLTTGFSNSDEDDKTALAGEAPATKNEDLTSLLEGLSIGPASGPSADSKDLEVAEGGKITSQDTIFDLKTRSIKAIGRDTLGEELPRLWLARITKFILAHHTRGKFDNVEVADVHDEVKEWEESHQEDLGRLSILLRRIQDIALENEDTLLEIVRVEGGPLEVRKRLPDAGVAFSDEVKDKWLKWLGHEVEEPLEESHRYRDLYHDLYHDNYGNSDGDSDSEEGDLTACDAECGYCGKCSY
ncbi:hypothetical protein TgHK011_009434 [Trichoderma gracile]|nr:hypothetical protein TgHK011_009434 [Trichoderma gracile]